MTGSARQLVAAAIALFPALIAGRALAATDLPPAVGGTVGVFGERGEIVISHDIPFGGATFGGRTGGISPQLNLVHESQSMSGPSGNLIQIQPALDYFISPGVSVGGTVGISRGSGEVTFGGMTFSSTTTIVTLGARAGYNVPLGPVSSVWIRGGLAYAHASETGSPSFYTVPLTLFAGLLWHPVPHLFLGGGPALATDLIAKSGGNDAPKTTDIGLTSVIGGYFGGP